MRDARGFTLLEVLLATALAATLLLALWSLFSIYTNLFETGQTKTETSQLARALLRQLADDLHSAIQDPIPGVPTETRTTTPLRRFVLSGSTDQLRLDVLQLTPLQGNLTPVGDSERYSREPSSARVPELRTVYYTFQDPLASPDAEGRNLPGLVRRELDFETPYADQAGSGFGSQSAGPEPSGSGMPGDQLAGGSGSAESLSPDLVDASIIWVPEVVRVEFRYFDGNGWTGQWNSLARKSLPVAVEVAIQMGTVAEAPGTVTEAPGTVAAAPGTVVEPEQPELGETAEFGGELNAGVVPEPEGPTYRLVIDIPGSPKHPAPQKVQPITERPPPPPRPVPRRIAPRRLPPARPTVRPLADEWMRTQP